MLLVIPSEAKESLFRHSRLDRESLCHFDRASASGEILKLDAEKAHFLSK